VARGASPREGAGVSDTGLQEIVEDIRRRESLMLQHGVRGWDDLPRETRERYEREHPAPWSEIGRQPKRCEGQAAS
jgi:hypothetical protein